MIAAVTLTARTTPGAVEADILDSVRESGDVEVAGLGEFGVEVHVTVLRVDGEKRRGTAPSLRRQEVDLLAGIAKAVSGFEQPGVLEPVQRVPDSSVGQE